MDNLNIITISDCEQIIRTYLKSDNFKIVDNAVQQFGESTHYGSLGEHLLLKIKILMHENQSEHTFFAKRSPILYPLSSQYARRLKSVPREIFTYQVLFEKFNTNIPGFQVDFVPKCYLGRDENLLVIENLAENAFASEKNLGIEELNLALGNLAKLHAGSLAYEEIKSGELGRTYRLIDEYANYLEEPIFNKKSELSVKWCNARIHNLTALMEYISFSNLVPEDFKIKLVKLAEDVYQTVETSRFRSVVCHGDLLANNILFKKENGTATKCKFVDFALIQYSPPARDVLFLIYMCTTRRTRKMFLQELLNHYYVALKAELAKAKLDINKILPLWDFEASVRYLLPQTKLLASYYSSYLLASDEFFTNLAKYATKFEEFLFGNSTPFAVELFQKDARYKYLMTESLLELEDTVAHDGIMIEDCYQIIENKIGHTSYEFVGFTIKSLAKMSGFLGAHHKLEIIIRTSSEEKTLCFFVKFPPTGSTQLSIVNGTSAFFKEVSMFRTFLPLMEEHAVDVIKECTIPCYLAIHRDLVVFDDFEILKYSATNPRVPFDHAFLKLVLKQLAKFHAATFILEEKLSEETGTTFRLIDHYKDELRESFFLPKETHVAARVTAAGIEAIPYQIDLFPNAKLKISREDFKKLAQSFGKMAYEIIKPSQKFRNCICHGDLWSTNFMVKEEDGQLVDCRIIDFQIIRYCPPAHDLLCVLYTVTNRATRCKFMNELIDFYFDELKMIVEQNNYSIDKFYSCEDFRSSCEYAEPQAVIQSVIYYHMIMSNPENMMEYMKDENIMRKAFLDDRVGYLTDMYKRDPHYKARLEESIEDLQDLCVKYLK